MAFAAALAIAVVKAVVKAVNVVNCRITVVVVKSRRIQKVGGSENEI